MCALLCVHLQNLTEIPNYSMVGVCALCAPTSMYNYYSVYCTMLFIIFLSYSICLHVGTASLINEHPHLVHDMMQKDPSDTLCRKDIGKAHRLRKWSRGHQFIVRGGGHIDAWQPLYRLEAYCRTHI